VEECTFHVGGSAAGIIGVPFSDTMLMLIPPQRPVGFADVVVSSGARSFVAKNAVYYFDPNSAPDAHVFERVLFPVLFNATGVNGSDWRSEARALNTTDGVIATFRQPAILQTFSAYGIDEHGATWMGRPQYPRGVSLLVPRAESENLSFSLRIRDVSRSEEGFGTSIPVVRESQMFPGTMTMLDVPLDPAYRVKLRIYGYGDAVSGAGRVSGIGEFTMSRSCTDALTCASTPWYAELDLPAREKDTRENLFITPPAGIELGWAFATVTNNQTQQVTIVTPDGTGGERCNPCTIP
jgi:hypothetical protein